MNLARLSCGRFLAAAPVLALALAGCVKTSAIPLSGDTVEVVAEAAPACGVGGAQKAAQQAAAVTTISSGFDRFAVIGSAHPGARLTHISQVGASAIAVSRSTAAMTIRMFRNDDPAGKNALDARSVLGSDWQAIVKKGGPTNC